MKLTSAEIPTTPPPRWTKGITLNFSSQGEVDAFFSLFNHCDTAAAARAAGLCPADIWEVARDFDANPGVGIGAITKSLADSAARRKRSW